MLRLENLLLFSPWRTESLPCEINAFINWRNHWQTGATQSASESKAQEAHVFSQMKHTKRKLPLGNGVGHVPRSQNLWQKSCGVSEEQTCTVHRWAFLWASMKWIVNILNQFQTVLGTFNSFDCAYPANNIRMILTNPIIRLLCNPNMWLQFLLTYPA